MRTGCHHNYGDRYRKENKCHALSLHLCSGCQGQNRRQCYIRQSTALHSQGKRRHICNTQHPMAHRRLFGHRSRQALFYGSEHTPISSLAISGALGEHITTLRSRQFKQYQSPTLGEQHHQRAIRDYQILSDARSLADRLGNSGILT